MYVCRYIYILIIIMVDSYHRQKLLDLLDIATVQIHIFI